MHTISSFLYPPISLHPSIFPLIPPPPPLLHLEGFPFLCFSALLTRERRRNIFSLFPFLPFPTTLLPSSPFFFPSLLPLFQKFVKPPPPPPVSLFPIHYFFPFPLSIYLPFPHSPPSLILHSRIRERIFTKHMENGEKLCTGLVWEEMMSIKD